MKNEKEIWDSYNNLLLSEDISRLRKIFARYELFKKTLNEYNELKGRVNDLSKIEEEHQSHIESLKDQIKDLLAQRDYLQKSLDSKQADTTKLIDVMNQRNFIEAKEKKMK